MGLRRPGVRGSEETGCPGVWGSEETGCPGAPLVAGHPDGHQCLAAGVLATVTFTAAQALSTVLYAALFAP